MKRRLILYILAFLYTAISLYYASYAHAEGNLKKAYKLMQEKDWGGAEQKFLQYLKGRPEDMGARNDLAYVYYNLGKYHEALNLLNAILKDSEEDVLALFRRGLVFFKLEDYSRGLSDFQRVSILSPQFGDGWTEFNMGAAYFRLGQWGEAIGWLQKAIRRNQREFENYIYYYLNIGYAFYKTGRYDEAVSVYKQGLMRFSEDEWLLENIGWSLQKSGKKEESIEYLTKAAEIGYKKLGSLKSASVALPFNGQWKVTHGNDEGYTHRGLGGRYSYDFIVVDEKGRSYSGSGKDNKDHFCFGRNMLAPVSGVVEGVENTFPDNDPWKDISTPEWWGNYVRIRGEDGFYSLLMHLRRGSVTVKEGQSVKKGDKIGECGNSGNSKEPHLHFHISFGEDKHWITVPSEFENYIISNNGKDTAIKKGIPKKGEIVRQEEY